MSDLANAMKKMISKMEENKNDKSVYREILTPRAFNYLVKEGAIESRFFVSESLDTSVEMAIIQVLEQENQKLREALVSMTYTIKFYAEAGDAFNGFDTLDDLSFVTSGNLSVEVIGKRARQALETHKELIETLNKELEK